MWRAVVLIAVAGLALASSAIAQPIPETVVVTADKLHSGVTPNAIAHDFVGSLAAPTVLRDGIARWQTAVCPDFKGLAQQYVAVMQAHFRAIAQQAGAKVRDKGCRPNLSVYFTPQPQAVLDQVHYRGVEALGYHGATTVTHAIQAWYMTGTGDGSGQVFLDQDSFFGMNTGGPGPPAASSGNTASFMSVGGWRAHPDLSSDLLYVTIIVDSQKTGKMTVGEIADYVAMMGLSQTNDYDDCHSIPSIANLLTSNCDDSLKPVAITPTDIAFLRGVYKMDAGATLKIQQDQIASEMAPVLAGGK